MKSLLLGMGLLIGICSNNRVVAQEQEVQQLLLNVEKLAQLKNILEDLKQGYEIVAQGYSTIRNISEGNFKLHDLFLDGLLQVSPAVKRYHRVADIIQAQIRLVKEYKAAYKQFDASGLINPGELDYIHNVYGGLLKQSLKSIEALAIVVTDRQLRMSDDERLTAIDAIWQEVADSLAFLRRFNNEGKVLLLQRSKESSELSGLHKTLLSNK